MSDDVRESRIEKHLRERMKGLGGECLKLNGTRGMPDRLCVFPNGTTMGNRPVFVELKKKGEPLEPLQRLMRDKLTGLGQLVYRIDSMEGVDQFIALYCAR